MANDTIIAVENLGKRYRLGAGRSNERYTALRDVLTDKAKSLFRRTPLTSDVRSLISDEFWALKEVSFGVKQGEVLGIIGRNGAGKSTLLKILSRITEPTEGKIRIKGRVASLLEVGTGFHPELTGRENIYLNGAILGMSRTEIKAKFDEIVAFADVEKFLDTPVKRYSSGMYVRLAFAVAAHLEPEILVVDEVLAVGDAEFQKKCLGKMQEVALGEGRTVLFVSHNMAAIRRLCSIVLYFETGRVVGYGDAAEQIAVYERHTETSAVTSFGRTVSIGRNCELRSIRINPNPVESGRQMEVSLEFTSKAITRIDELCLLIYSATGVRVAVVDLRVTNVYHRVTRQAGYAVTAQIEHLSLVEGDYLVGLWIRTDDFSGDLFDLVTLRVSSARTGQSIVPYAPHLRGFVEMNASIHYRAT
jgi:lipopolysaccharide transport system ATP-binding protein